MKKYLIILLSLVLTVFFAGCGMFSKWTPPKYTDDDYFFPDEPGNQGKPGDKPGKPDDPDDPNNPDDPGDEPLVFTVILRYRNEEGDVRNFYPDPDMELLAIWKASNGSPYSAPFDATGVATAEGLDGDYSVSLSGLPGNYAYDPNGNEVSNDNPDIIIELMTMHPIDTGAASNWKAGRGDYTTSNPSCISIKEFGAYKATLYSPNDFVVYEYEPKTPGEILLESMVDTSVNEVDPYAWVIKAGNRAYKDWTYTAEKVTDGGSSNTTTKNFRVKFTIDENYLGNVFVFKVQGTSVHSFNKSKPIEILFRITYLGAYEEYKTVKANGPFYTGSTPSGTWEWSYHNKENGNDLGNGTYITDGTNGIPMRFKLKGFNWDGSELAKGEKWLPMEWRNDTNGNGKPDIGDAWIDTNGNGEFDKGEPWKDTNGNGVFDDGDECVDLNGDGKVVVGDQWWDTNGNGEFDEGDEWWDDNNDGVCGLCTGDGFYYWYDEVKYADNGGWGPLLWARMWDGTGFKHDNVNQTMVFISENDKRDYSGFLKTYKSYSKRDSTGAYVHPVNQEIIEALQFLLVANQYFYDGTGSGDNKVGTYNDYMFLVLCGYYL